jgi:hypothetical protein
LDNEKTCKNVTVYECCPTLACTIPQVEAARDSVEVNTMDKATDANGNPSTDYDDTFDVVNMANDEPKDLMIHDGFETNDTSDKQS